MAQYSELPVYKATYDLLLAIFQFTKDFSKEYKYTVDESLKNETIELSALIYRVNRRPDKTESLQAAREHIDANEENREWPETRVLRASALGQGNRKGRRESGAGKSHNSGKPKCLPQAQHRHFGCAASTL